MRRLLTPLLLLAVALATAGVATGAQALNFQPDEKAVFPNLAYRVTLPKQQALTVDRVAVSENGGPVDSLYVTTPGTGGNTNGTVLLIDTSESMAGRPIANAIEAAKAFSERKNPNQQLAIIGFDGEVDVLLPFTTSQQEIDAVLAKPIDLQQGTRIYDGVKESLDLIAANGLQTSSIVLLSDGADVGSDTSREDTVERLEGSSTRVFSVGLRSGAFESTSLKALAEASDGQYEEAASAGELTPIFDAIGFKLANEYEVSWRSLQGPGTPVKIVIAVNGFAPYTSSYTTPDLPSPPPVIYEEGFLDSIIQSWVFMLVVILMAAALIGYAVFIATRKPDETLRRRLGQYVTIQSEEDARRRRQEVATLTAATRTERKRQRKWFTSLEHDLDIANLSLSPTAFLAATFGCTLIGMIVLALIMQSFWGLLIAAIAGPLIARAILKNKITRRQRAFGEQLPDNLDVLAGALRAGHSLVSGIAVMADDAAEPSKSEYRRVLADEQLGVPLDEALSVTVLRMNNRDLDQVAIVAALQRDTGGNSAEVLDQVAENIRGRMELRRLIRVLTAQGRLARWIVSLLPVALMGGIYLIQPDYLEPLFNETIGKVLMVVAAVMIVSGSLVIKKIVDIDI